MARKSVKDEVLNDCVDFLPESRWLAIAASLRLSVRESQILRCILKDEPEALIADRLDISQHTVHTHLERLYRKLGVNSRCQTTVRVFAEYVRLEQFQQNPASRCRKVGG